MRLAIIGSRSFKDKNFAEQVFISYFLSKTSEIISGGASGADDIANYLANLYKIKFTCFPAKWNDFSEPCSIGYRQDGSKYNKLAGFNRNKDIIKESDTVLAFWDGDSNGTRNSLKIAKELKKATFIIYY